jgi:hypothetical protein
MAMHPRHHFGVIALLLLAHAAGVANTWVHGYWLSPFGFSWKYLDIDVAMRDAKLAAARK